MALIRFLAHRLYSSALRASPAGRIMEQYLLQNVAYHNQIPPDAKGKELEHKEWLEGKIHEGIGYATSPLNVAREVNNPSLRRNLLWGAATKYGYAEAVDVIAADIMPADGSDIVNEDYARGKLETGLVNLARNGVLRKRVAERLFYRFSREPDTARRLYGMARLGTNPFLGKTAESALAYLWHHYKEAGKIANEYARALVLETMNTEEISSRIPGLQAFILGQYKGMRTIDLALKNVAAHLDDKALHRIGMTYFLNENYGHIVAMEPDTRQEILEKLVCSGVDEEISLKALRDLTVNVDDKDALPTLMKVMRYCVDRRVEASGSHHITSLMDFAVHEIDSRFEAREQHLSRKRTLAVDDMCLLNAAASYGSLETSDKAMQLIIAHKAREQFPSLMDVSCLMETGLDNTTERFVNTVIDFPDVNGRANLLQVLEYYGHFSQLRPLRKRVRSALRTAKNSRDREIREQIEDRYAAA